MLSKKAKYAIKALIFLGKNYGEEPIRISEIATEEHIPQKFLEQILLLMRNAGLLYSKKGAGGGYSLNKSPKDIFLTEVIHLIDGRIAMVPCVSEDFYQRCTECKEEATCGIRDVFSEVEKAMLAILSGTSIHDIIKREEKLKSRK